VDALVGVLQFSSPNLGAPINLSQRRRFEDGDLRRNGGIAVTSTYFSVN
jgi:hypothetical protein